MMRVGVFLEPLGELRSEVLRWKSKVGDRFGHETAYCSHPPHVSVYVFEFDSTVVTLETMFEKFDSLTRVVHRRDISVDETICFENDLMTGGDTIAFRFSKKSSQELKADQTRIIEHLSPFAIIPPQTAYRNLLEGHGVFSENLRQHGFPFAGDIWIPHCTVASLPHQDHGEMKQEFLDQNVALECCFGQLSLWSISGDVHEKMTEINLL